MSQEIVESVRVISRASSTVRRDRALQRVRASGLEASVFTAVEGRELAAATGYAGGLTDGELGCYASHRQILGALATSGSAGFHLVLEDDVVLSPGFTAALARAVDEARGQGVGMVQLGWVPLADQVRTRALLRERLAANRGVRMVAATVSRGLTVDPPLLVDAPLSWGTHCYAVQGSFARLMIDGLPPEPLAPVDYHFRALANLWPGRMRRARFPIATQDLSFTSEVNVSRSQFVAPQIDEHGRLIRR